jgi:hypothetical protein
MPCPRHLSVAPNLENNKVLCASNNVTYLNWCSMMNDACSSGIFLRAISVGPCNPNEGNHIHTSIRIRLSNRIICNDWDFSWVGLTGLRYMSWGDLRNAVRLQVYFDFTLLYGCPQIPTWHLCTHCLFMTFPYISLFLSRTTDVSFHYLASPKMVFLAMKKKKFRALFSF